MKKLAMILLIALILLAFTITNLQEAKGIKYHDTKTYPPAAWVKLKGTPDTVVTDTTGMQKDWCEGNVYHIAFVYIYNGVSYDSRIVSAVKSAVTTESSGCYSVKTFYAKYGMFVVPTFTSVAMNYLPPIGSYTVQDWNFITAYLSTNKGLYQNNEMVFVILDSYSPTHDSVSAVDFPAGYLQWAYWGGLICAPLSGPPSGYGYDNYHGLHSDKQSMLAYSIAHEIGHEIGCRDHYVGVGSNGNFVQGINDANCVMNRGGDGDRHLTKDTIFGAEDLKTVHFSYIWKYDYWMS